MSEETMTSDLRNYELLYIVPNQYTEGELNAIKEKIDSMLKKYGAILGYEELMGKKKLAYPINKIAHGYYVMTEFELADGREMKNINEFLRLDKEILRAQIISKKKMTAEEQEKERHQRADKPEERVKLPVEEKPRSKPSVEKKVDIKNLDEKLAEILQTDDIV
ncbi:MAG: 30S ribosomal protein S6 [Patescibacteria group bacterium]